MAEAQTFNFELVSPEERLISGPAKMVVIPGEEGDFGVLPHHAATISSIRPGVLEIHMENSETPRRVFVAGGFADVSATNCTVLAEEAVNVESINKEDMEQAIRNLQEDLGMAGSQSEKDHIARRLMLAKAKLSAATGTIVV